MSSMYYPSIYSYWVPYFFFFRTTSYCSSGDGYNLYRKRLSKLGNQHNLVPNAGTSTLMQCPCLPCSQMPSEEPYAADIAGSPFLGIPRRPELHLRQVTPPSRPVSRVARCWQAAQLRASLFHPLSSEECLGLGASPGRKASHQTLNHCRPK
jgi:hypothetical protein